MILTICVTRGPEFAGFELMWNELPRGFVDDCVPALGDDHPAIDLGFLARTIDPTIQPNEPLRCHTVVERALAEWREVEELLGE